MCILNTVLSSQIAEKPRSHPVRSEAIPAYRKQEAPASVLLWAHDRLEQGTLVGMVPVFKLWESCIQLRSDLSKWGRGITGVSYHHAHGQIQEPVSVNQRLSEVT